MPLERIPLKDLNLDQYDFNVRGETQTNHQQPQQEESLASSIVGGAKNIAARAITSPLALAELPGAIYDYATGHERKDMPASQRLYETLGGTEPTSIAGKILGHTASNLPLMLLTGGLGSGKLAADLAGSAGMVAAEELGLPVPIQIGAGIAASHKFPKAAKYIDNTMKGIKSSPQINKIDAFKKSKYNLEKALGQESYWDTKGLSADLNKLKKEIENSPTKEPYGFSKKQQVSVLENIEKAKKSVNPSIVSEESAKMELAGLKHIAQKIDKTNNINMDNILPKDVKFNAQEIEQLNKNISFIDEIFKKNGYSKKELESILESTKKKIDPQQILDSYGIKITTDDLFDTSKIRDKIDKSVKNDPLKKTIVERFVNTSELKNNLPKLSQEEIINKAIQSIDKYNILDLENFDIKRRPVSASELYNLQKVLNEGFIPGNSKAAQYSQRIHGLFADELNKIASVNPKWGEAWKTADELHQIQRYKFGITKALEEISQSTKFGKVINSPSAQAFLSILAGAGTAGISGSLGKGLKVGAAGAIPPLLLAGTKGAESLTRGVKLYNVLNKSPEGKKLIWNIIEDAAKYNQTGKIRPLLYDFTKLNDVAKDFDKTNKEKKLESIPLNKIDINQYEFVR